MSKRQFGSLRRLASGRWQARYRAPDGRRLAAATTFTTKRVALAWLAEQQSDIERGRWKSPEQIAAEEAGAEASAVTIRCRDACVGVCGACWWVSGRVGDRRCHRWARGGVGVAG